MNDKHSTGVFKGRAKDWAGGGRSFLLIWGLPALALFAAPRYAGESAAFVQAAVVAWWGLACVINAARCRRMHCVFTGPFFLVMAALILLARLQLIALGAHEAEWLTYGLFFGTLLLWLGPEMVLGKYFR